MMRQMRENTKWIMLVTALAFVALMIFQWGMDVTGRSGFVAGGPIGKVNGEEITYEDWLRVYNNVYQQQQAAVGEITPAMRRQIEDAAWDQIVTQRLLQQELDRRGLRATDEEIREAARVAPPPELMSSPVFQTDGQFDPVKYNQFLAQNDPALLLQLEAYYRDVIPRSKLYYQTAAGVYPTDGQLWRMYRDANETATVEFIAFSPELLVPANAVTITDKEIRDYYQSHREDFVRPAQVDIRYIMMGNAPPRADTIAAREHAVLMRAAAVAGESFDTLAARAAEEGVSARYSGEFTAVRGRSVPAIDQVVFSTSPGSITEPILTQAGYHIVKVESRRADTAQVRQIVIPIELSRASEDSILNRADELEDLSMSVGLDAAAERLGLEVRTAQLTPALPILPEVGAVDDGLDWAMVAKPGDVSELLESENAFYIMQLVSRREEGVLSLEEAKPTIQAYLLREARIDRAMTNLAPVAQRAAAGESLEEIARSYNLRVNRAGPFTRGEGTGGLGRLTPAAGAAFALAPGQASPLIESEGQIFILRGIDRREASRTAWQAQAAEQRARVTQGMAESRWNQYLASLRENAEIVDNRNRVLRGPAPEVQASR